MRSSVTLRDVAREAGVSHQTVSRVINGSTHVDPETRKRVQEAVDSLGYKPNQIARSMAQGRSHTLACLSPNLTDFTFAAIIEGAEQTARQHGYFLLSSSAHDAETFASLAEELVISRRIEGMLVMNPYIDDRYRYLPSQCPVVMVGAHPRKEACNSVSLDDEGAAVTATRHLINLGHRSIAIITGPLVEDCSQDRLQGCRMAFQTANIPWDDRLLYEGDWSASSGYDGILKILESPVKVTAVLAQNDRMAIGVMRALREAGYRVPEDISVIGFDDMPLASYFDPPLTTMRQDLEAIGREAARLLIDTLESPTAGLEHVRMPTQLIVRASTHKTEPAIQEEEVIVQLSANSK